MKLLITVLAIFVYYSNEAESISTIEEGTDFELNHLIANYSCNFLAEASYKNQQELWRPEINKLANLRVLSNNPVTTFVNLVTVVSGLFTIWSWIETRDDQKKKDQEPDTSELVEDLDSQITNLSSQLNDVKLTLKQMSCRFDVVYLKDKSLIGQECLRFIKPTSNYQKLIVKSRA